MQLPLFKALQSIKIDDDRATDVVRSFEEYSAMKMAEATAPLVAQLEAVKSEITSLKLLIGFVGAILGVIGLAPSFFHLFK